MRDTYPVPQSTVTTEQEIKNSRFICTVGRGSSDTEVFTYIDEIRQQHPGAAHVCWAYIAGPPDSARRGMSDDGEPKGTAGRPMLSILDHSGIGEIWTAVTRYFGGIKLGTGGLVRAYGSSVKQTLDILKTAEHHVTQRHQLTVPYPMVSQVEKEFAISCCSIVEKTYTDFVTYQIDVPLTHKKDLDRKLANLSNGQLQLITLDS